MSVKARAKLLKSTIKDIRREKFSKWNQPAIFKLTNTLEEMWEGGKDEEELLLPAVS